MPTAKKRPQKLKPGEASGSSALLDAALLKREKADRNLASVYIEIGSRLRKMREERKITLREMARRLACSAAYVSDLERGRRNWDHDGIKCYEFHLGI